MSHSPRNKRAITEALIGISDGIIIPLATITAASVLTTGSVPVIAAGLIIIVLGSIIIGIAGYMAAASRQRSLALQSRVEEEKANKEELEKTIRLFKKIGLGEEMQNQVAAEIEKDSKDWNDYLEKYAQQLEKPDATQLPKTALSIALSFTIGGFIPLAPYFFTLPAAESLAASVTLSAVALGIFGFLKGKVNHEPAMQGALRLVLLGLFVAAGTYGVAHIFLR